MSVNPEYLRRNLLVAKSIGINSNAKAAMARVRTLKRQPAWLVKYLQGILDRAEPLPKELAAYRDSVPTRLPDNESASLSEGK